MERPRLVLDVSRDPALGNSLAAGGVFVPDRVFPIESELDLIVQLGDRAIAVDAKVVFVDPNDHGVGVELIGFCPEMRVWIADFISGEAAYENQAGSSAEVYADEPIDGAAPYEEPPYEEPPYEEPPDDAADASFDDGEPEIEIIHETHETSSLDRMPTEPGGGEDVILEGEIDGAVDAMIAPPALGSEPAIAVESDESRRVFQSIHERLRHLTLADQIKMAHSGDINERVILERLYGKTVWEALLRNPRLTGPEVGRIARMGALPRPLLEIIMNNGGWLQIPEVRRALLTSKRLGVEHVMKVLRMLPKHELKLAAVQTVYSSTVRDTARRMLREV